ncbi:MAG: iron ABC transporter permease [Tessaracoccus sp.]
MTIGGKAADQEGTVRRPRGVLVIVVVALVLLVSMTVAVGVGPLSLTPSEVLRSLAVGVGLADHGDIPPSQAAVVWDVRLPRVLLAAMVGACLAIAGAALQGLFGNSLADAGVIGVTSGASLGAICSIVLGLQFFGQWTVPAAAFVAGLLTTSLIYTLAKPGRKGGTVQILLVGIAVTAVAGSINGFFTYIASTTALEAITFWSMGSLNRASWESLSAGVLFFLAGAILLLFLAKPLDVLALGERQAQHVGLHVKRVRLLLVVATSLVVGAAVALAGSIGFVGLVVPHIVRLAVGPVHRWLLPISALGGALMIVLADIGARTLNPPSEIPIGLFTGVVGGPFFLWLLSRRRTEMRA